MRMSQPEHDILVALVVVHRRHGRATLRQVATERQRTISATRRLLRRLEQRHLVQWDEIGSLRPQSDLVVVGGDVYVGRRIP